jgi:restriction system protein
MAVWMVRAGRSGEREDLALRERVAVVGWDELSDLSDAGSREDIELMLREQHPDAKPGTLVNWSGQLWSFVNRIEPSDLVVLPLKTRSAVAVGTPAGDYEYRPSNPLGARHVRRVDWIRDDIPRTAFDQDLLYSLGAFMTVCQIRREQAEERIRGVLEGRTVASPRPTTSESMATDDDVSTAIDLGTAARDQIRTYIGQRIKGHDLSRLVDEILKVQGYRTELSLPGPDGGVDIIGGKGPMGFEDPRLVVQVKSSDSPADVRVLRELQGVMRNFGADRGLLVSWGGFKTSVYNEARQLFFEIRLWDADDLIEALTDSYSDLPDDVQADLPLKRVWTLVLDEESV